MSQDPIPWDSGRYRLGVESMDATHAEFSARVNALAKASGNDFTALFLELVAHTEQHFAGEERLMDETGFSSTAEHRGEHRRVLGEMRHFAARATAGKVAMAKSYVRDRLPDWFALHAATMDSALAARLLTKSPAWGTSASGSGAV